MLLFTDVPNVGRLNVIKQSAVAVTSAESLTQINMPLTSPLWAGPQVIKLFYGCNFLKLVIARVFVPASPFQPSLMFVGKARSLLLGGAHERSLLCKLGPCYQTSD
jgi:hypothetical protein